MLSVAVHVGEYEELGADLVQLYERENGHRPATPSCCAGASRSLRVLDLPWEESDPEHLERARGAEGRVVLAGRLGPDNVRAAIEAVQPWAVDAASRLEVEPGIKDHDRVREFVAAAR